MAILMRCIPVRPTQDMTLAEFKAWLRQFDMDHDGRVSQEELEEALRSVHTWFAGYKAREAMKQADSNRSGLIDDAKEIEKLAAYAKQRLNMKSHQKSFK